MSVKQSSVIPLVKAAHVRAAQQPGREVVMVDASSAVLEYGVPEPAETAAVMADKLRFHTDSWDLSVDLKSGHPDIIVIDARSRQAYAAGHIPGAVSFPHGEMTADAAAKLDRRKIYVVY